MKLFPIIFLAVSGLGTSVFAADVVPERINITKGEGVIIIRVDPAVATPPPLVIFKAVVG